jgi:hypothetical protein
LGSSSFEVSLGGSGKAKAVSEEDLVIFPNPASQAFTLHLNGLGHEMERVTVFGITGNIVYDSGKMTSKRRMVDVSGFSPGVYTVRVVANGEVLAKMIEVVR